MIYLLLCILSSTLIFVVFKYIDRFKVAVLPVIVYNYLFASALGFIIADDVNTLFSPGNHSWIPLSIFIGILFIIMFFIIGKSSQKAGISVTTIASKMSVAVPVIFSILADPEDDFNLLKISGIVLALLAVFLTIYRKKTLEVDRDALLYPVILFVGMGLVDSLVKYSQMKYIGDRELGLFSAFLFFIAFATGIFYLFLKTGRYKSLFDIKALLWGLMLGISNFGSIYFIIRALNYKYPSGTGIDSSIVFGINNTGIVVLSVLTGYLVFREKLLRVNYIGIILALVAILIFSYA
jgi:drug/metabolite transporter (DMT)-like permease